MTAYYNELDEYAAQWLRNLIKAGYIAPGDVDTRSIEDVSPDDLKQYTQCHFFAGIGVWSYALRRAGWEDSRPVWSGSCPCQPFSVAGQGAGFADERHLWPAFHWLIEQCGPRVVFGEQVASKDGYAWLDLVQADLEGTGYTVGAVVAPAAGFGAPHQRHRMYWVADTKYYGSSTGKITGSVSESEDEGRMLQLEGRSSVSGLADTLHSGRAARRAESRNGQIAGGGEFGGLADADGGDTGTEGIQRGGEHRQFAQNSGTSFWSAADWIYCRDEKYRPVEPGTFPLAHGAPSRVGRLRAYGNAICAPQAEEFIKAYLEVRP